MELVFTIISKILKVPMENISIDSTSDTIENWDSLGHMNLILALEEELQISGIFVKIGQTPNSNFVKIFLELNEKEQIIVNPQTMESSKKGIFAAGDVNDIPQKQYVIAAGDGAKAAISAYQFLKEKNKI